MGIPPKTYPRAILALCVAVGVNAIFLASPEIFRGDDSVLGFGFVLFYSVIFGLPVALIFGLPTYAFAKRLGILNARLCVFAGILLTCVGGSWFIAEALLDGPLIALVVLLTRSGIGAANGLLVWRIYSGSWIAHAAPNLTSRG